VAEKNSRTTYGPEKNAAGADDMITYSFPTNSLEAQDFERK
jgi:hypothetical protein